MEVNSYHKQAIKDVAPGFKIIAKCDDGIIEGIEKDNIIGVQWHPESVLDMEFFEGFIKIFFNWNKWHPPLSKKIVEGFHI